MKETKKEFSQESEQKTCGTDINKLLLNWDDALLDMVRRYRAVPSSTSCAEFFFLAIHLIVKIKKLKLKWVLVPPFLGYWSHKLVPFSRCLLVPHELEDQEFRIRNSILFSFRIHTQSYVFLYHGCCGRQGAYSRCAENSEMAFSISIC
jgi:hypothetical protein